MPVVAVDAMGGDHAPREPVLGAVAAAAEGIDVVLVGDAEPVHRLLQAEGCELPVVPAAEVITMADDPAHAIREKRNASVSVAARLVAGGEADAFVSAGSTGAALAAATLLIGRLPGVSRPAIGSLFPTGQVVVDVGANLDVNPEHLVQFAVMGCALASVYSGLEHPRVGLLNIGEEPGKGRKLEKAAHEMLTAAPLDFIGNVEGRDLGRDVDVIVTDGFTGNVLLKAAEGAARMVLQLMADELASRPDLAQPVADLAPALASVRARLDPENTGGAHLVGAAGVVVVAHGASSRLAVANAIRMAHDGVRRGLVDRIRAGLDG